MRLVPINCVKEGCYLAKTMYDLDGRILLAKGIKLTEKVVRKVAEIGIMSLYINDEYSDDEIEDTIKPELRQKAIKTMKDSFDSLLSISECVPGKLNKLQATEASRVKNECISKLSMVVEEIMNEVLEKKNALVNLVDIKSMDNYTYEHSVNVVVLSLMLGLELNYTKSKLHNLAIGAMLHDMGKVFVPKEVLLKSGKLTDAEFGLIKEHPSRGYEYLKSDEEISAMSKIIILQHHERIDGTGYPDGIDGSRIHEFSKIVSIADVYDALTSDRPYRMGLPPNEAIEYIMGSVDRYFDFDMINAFLRRIVPYPVGTMVKLSSGDVGVIKEINREYPLRPVVKIVWNPEAGFIDKLLNLMEINNIVIKGVEYKLPGSGE